jgi:hypothetical protein
MKIAMVYFEYGLGKKPAKINNQDIWQCLSENNMIVRKENIVRDSQ